MNARIPALTLVCATVLIVSEGPAQSARGAPNREGFWLGVGIGWGSAGFLWGGVGKRFGGLSGNFRLGGTLNRSILLGVESNGWGHSESGVSQSVGALTGNVYFYPSTTGTVYLKGGAGLVYRDQSSAFGVNLGVGIDLYTAKNFSLSPYVNYVAALSSIDPGVGRPNLLQLGVAAVWH